MILIKTMHFVKSWGQIVFQQVKYMAKSLKKIHFHKSFKEQGLFRLQASINMTMEERVREMYRLNYMVYGEKYGKVSKISVVYAALGNCRRLL